MRKSTCQRIAALCAALFLVCGCSYPQALRGESGIPEDQPALVEPPFPGDAPDIVMSISRDAGEILTDAAEYFCDEYSRITGANAEISKAIAPDADLLAARAQVALLNKKRQLEFNPPLAATATPFLYNGYNGFSMRANASATLEVLETSLRGQSRLIPLAAYYQGSRNLLADFPFSGYQSFELVYFGISDDAEMRAVAERLMSVPVIADTDAERMALYHLEEVNVTEASLAEIARQDSFDRTTYMVESYHNIVPVWMLARAEFYDALSPAQRAELTESIAYMTNMIDDAYLMDEEKSLAALGQVENLLISDNLSMVRNRVFNTLPRLSDTAGAQRRLARDLIDIMRRI